MNNCGNKVLKKYVRVDGAFRICVSKPDIYIFCFVLIFVLELLRKVSLLFKNRLILGHFKNKNKISSNFLIWFHRFSNDLINAK